MINAALWWIGLWTVSAFCTYGTLLLMSWVAQRLAFNPKPRN